jgi:hypothetical protein
VSTTTTQGAAAAAPPAGNPAVDAPRIPLGQLTGEAADEARQIGRKRLAEYDRMPDPRGLYGSSGGPDRITREEVRPRTIAFYVYDQDAVRSDRAWHAYWRQHTTARGGYAMHDPEKMAAAPPKPSRGIACVATGTWEQLRTWLETPEQASMFDLLGDAA